MRGYDRDDYGQSGDEYEDYEDDEDGEEYEEEEEDPKPTKEALAYLELRQRLKEQLRKKKSGSSLANSSNKKKELPYDKTRRGLDQPLLDRNLYRILNLKTKLSTCSKISWPVGNFDELVATGSTLLVDFQQGLEFLRRPQIDETSDLVKNVIRGNETKRVKSYVEAGCLNADDGRCSPLEKFGYRLKATDSTYAPAVVTVYLEVHTCQLGLCDHLSKGKNVLNELECLLEDVNGAMRTAMGNLPDFQDDSFVDRLNEEACNGDKEEFTSSHPKRNEVTDYAVVMGVIYSMVKQDYMMQERIVSARNLKSSSGELESYCLMWSLRPFINNEIMDYAWKLIP
ncbi:uncharacterized protein [Pyrus communis]|uniref:uncharacterized protein n=1 Tax=Pyrus communis TaxID=23211 RepID=UPI0035C2601F